MILTPRIPLQAPADEGVGGAGGNADAEKKDGAAITAALNAEGKEAAKAETKPDAKPGDAAGKTEAKTSEQGKASKDAAAKLELKLPDGVKLDEATWGKFEPLLKEFGMDSDKASKLAAAYVEATNERVKQETQAWDQIRNKWGEELKADKEFGGANYDTNKALAEKAVIRFGGQDLSDQLAKYGVDSLPVLAKAFAAIGKAIKEDSSSTSTTDGKATLSREERRAAFYDDMKRPAATR